jgi:cytochrome c-type biogenesis protein CcmH
VIKRLVAGLLAGLALGAPAAAAAAGCPKTTLPNVEDEVMCLQCGVPLNLAEDAPSAQRERIFIQQLIDRCESKPQIKRALVAQFGSRILAQPKGSAAWLVPALAFAGGIAVVALAWVRWRRARRAAGEPSREAPLPVPAADAARLEADLDRYET